jgi:hypothetical protein
MVHLSINERLKVVGIYYELLTTRTTDKFKMISAIAQVRKINISKSGVSKIIKKWIETGEFLYFWYASILEVILID